jgi:Cu(I)-responsive transcriptional regulator
VSSISSGTRSKLVKIGAIAKKTGLSVQALRYYQKRGLIQPKQQLESGYRLYNQEVVERITFIQQCQGMGFSLDEIVDLLNLQADPSAKAFEVKQKVDDKLLLIDQKLIELTNLKSALVQLSESCSGEGLVGDCPIISTLWQQR